MRRTIFTLLLLALTLSAGASRHRNLGYSCGLCMIPDGDNITSCDQMRVVINDEDAARAEETVNVPIGRRLAITAKNGGIHVRGTDSAQPSIKACKATALAASLDQVHVRVNGNTVTSDGPANKPWIVFFIVSLPRAAIAELKAYDGPISIFGVDASVTAHTENGPISAKDSSGVLDLSADNGPIGFEGSTGDVSIHTSNGPISVKLRDSAWRGVKLNAVTDNGPLELVFPRGYRSGISVDTDGNSPVRCHAADCRNGRVKFDRDVEDGHWPSHIDLGSGARAVTLATSNGPVKIEER
jgi:hypothetical protein